jgi:CubicO group peptidase (beta-lactamase class C family)
MGELSPNTTNHLKTLVDNVTKKKDGAPGLVVVAVDRNGDTLFEHASGKRGLDSSEPMTTDTVFWIASCTKMIVSIAAMQLVEQGKLALDDVELVERICPELKEVKVLVEDSNGNLKLVEKERGITLRMLLSHTGNFPLQSEKPFFFIVNISAKQLDSATPFSIPNSTAGTEPSVWTSSRVFQETSSLNRS